MEQFVAKLGVTRAAFHKYVTCKSIPGLGVLSKARRYWGVKLSYADLDESFFRSKRKDPRQEEFQFSIAGVSKDQIEVKKFSARGESCIDLVITIDFSKDA